MTPDPDDRLERERAFHDALADEMRAAQLPPDEPREPELALFATAEIKRGDRVLDVGCGTGDLTLQLLDIGARVTALDLSPGMTALAEQRVKTFRPRATCEFRAAPLEASGLPDQSFDVIVGRYVLHHVDLRAAGPELERLLAPGGRAVFLETSARNRLLMLARAHLAGRFGIPRFGTPDERPLSPDDISVLAGPFASAQVDYPVFEFLRIFDRQMLRFRWRPVSLVLEAADHFVQRRVPRLRAYSFRVYLTLRKAG